jgi:hypothetical protein
MQARSPNDSPVDEVEALVLAENFRHSSRPNEPIIVDMTDRIWSETGAQTFISTIKQKHKIGSLYLNAETLVTFLPEIKEIRLIFPSLGAVKTEIGGNGDVSVTIRRELDVPSRRDAAEVAETEVDAAEADETELGEIASGDTVQEIIDTAHAYETDDELEYEFQETQDPY